MSATVTVTGKAGPGKTVTAQQYTGVLSIQLDTTTSQLTLYTEDRIVNVNITAQNTFTVTKSGNTYTVSISA